MLKSFKNMLLTLVVVIGSANAAYAVQLNEQDVQNVLKNTKMLVSKLQLPVKDFQITGAMNNYVPNVDVICSGKWGFEFKYGVDVFSDRIKTNGGTHALFDVDGTTIVDTSTDGCDFGNSGKLNVKAGFGPGNIMALTYYDVGNVGFSGGTVDEAISVMQKRLSIFLPQ